MRPLPPLDAVKQVVHVAMRELRIVLRPPVPVVPIPALGLLLGEPFFLKGWPFGEVFVAHPLPYARAANGDVNYGHRPANFALHLLDERKGRCAAQTGRLRRHLEPMALKMALLPGTIPRELRPEESNVASGKPLVELLCAKHLAERMVPFLEIAVHLEFHVALSGGKPHVAKGNVFYIHAVFAFNGHLMRTRSQRRRVEGDAPPAICARDSLPFGSAYAHRHFAARVFLAPDARSDAPLQDRVVGDYVRQPDFGPRSTCSEGDDD